MSLFRSRPLLPLLSTLLMLLPATYAAAQDGDSDGVVDNQDNCSVVVNPTQLDTNRDGLGNRCDTDYDNNGGCNPTDFVIFSNAFLSGAGDPNYDPDVDAEGDGAIGLSDFGVFKSYYLLAPGPSGLACAGTVPCTCDPPVLDTAAGVLSGDVELSWTVTAGFGYEIERRAAGGTWATVASVSTSGPSYIDLSPSPESYEYRMRADCSAVAGSPQWSEYSNVVTIELPAECEG